MLDGVKVNLGGRDYMVPPLNLKALKRLGPKLKLLSNLGDVPSDEEVDAVVEVLHSALVRNYPDITSDEVSDRIDLANLRPALMAVMGASGLTQGLPGEAASPQGSTGPASTGS